MVETTNFNGKNAFQGASENMKVTERFTRMADDMIQYRFTVEDPLDVGEPWTAEVPMAKTDGPIFEFACHETNYGIANILAGARADEKRAAEAEEGLELGHAHEARSSRLLSPALLLGASQVRAHHAFAAEFDVNKPLKLKGTLIKWEMVNPHSWFHIGVKDTDGKVTTWMIEGGSPNQLIRMGVTKNTVPVGTELVVEGYQAKDGTTRPSAATSCWPTASDCSSAARPAAAPTRRRASKSLESPRRRTLTCASDTASRARPPRLAAVFPPDTPASAHKARHPLTLVSAPTALS